MIKKLELYFHIPFCIKKCLYCDFLSAPASEETQDAYMEALLLETEGRAKEYQNYMVDTIFIGGGTPSAVKPEWIEQLLNVIRQHCVMSDTTEITMEINPGTVDREKLACYYNAGINRLSIGLQSARDAELRQMGRIHTWGEFQETYTLVKETGFQNINVDIMSALPGQSLESYLLTLEKVLQLTPQPSHLSAYSLIVEEGTPFAEMDEKGLLNLPDEECERQMYEQTKEVLERNGYTRYEISNYAKEGYECRHNVGYWNRTDYVGFGIGAASLLDNRRFENGSNLEIYLKNPLACRSNIRNLSVKEQMEEFMFLGLRMIKGVHENDFLANFGKTLYEVYGDVIERNKKEGLLECFEDSGMGKRLALTKKGINISNYVMAQFLFD